MTIDCAPRNGAGETFVAFILLRTVAIPALHSTLYTLCVLRPTCFFLLIPTALSLCACFCVLHPPIVTLRLSEKSTVALRCLAEACCALSTLLDVIALAVTAAEFRLLIAETACTGHAGTSLLQCCVSVCPCSCIY